MAIGATARRLVGRTSTAMASAIPAGSAIQVRSRLRQAQRTAAVTHTSAGTSLITCTDTKK